MVGPAPRLRWSGRAVVLRAAVASGAAVALLSTAAPAAGQNAGREVGFAVASLTITDGETFRLATGNADGSVFVRLPLGERTFVEPEVGFTAVGDGEATLLILNPALHVGRTLGASEAGGWFVAGHVAAQGVLVLDLQDDRHGDVAAGASAGHRLPVLDGHASVRVEGRYRQWFDSGTSTLSAIVKVALAW